jgi:hypothetical protein
LNSVNDVNNPTINVDHASKIKHTPAPCVGIVPPTSTCEITNEVNAFSVPMAVSSVPLNEMLKKYMLTTSPPLLHFTPDAASDEQFVDDDTLSKVGIQPEPATQPSPVNTRDKLFTLLTIATDTENIEKENTKAIINRERATIWRFPHPAL